MTVGAFRGAMRIGALGRGALAILLLAVLAGCTSSISEQVGDSVWVTPGKYAYHDCKQIAVLERAYALRQKELEELMGRAAQSSSGHAVGQLVYRSEYQQVLGERRQIATRSLELRCQSDSKWSSDRSMF